MRLIAIFLAIATLVAGTLASAKSVPLSLMPSSKWHVHQEEEFCRLARDFGTGDQRIRIIFERQGASDDFRLLLVGQPMKKIGDEKISITFGENGLKQETAFFAGTFDSEPMWFPHSQMSLIPGLNDSKQPRAKDQPSDQHNRQAAMRQHESATQQIMIGQPLSQPVILRTGSLGPAFAAFRQCTDDVMTRWGLDLDKHSDLKRIVTVVGNPARWVTYLDYPKAMFATSQPGVVEFRLIIGADGHVEDCRIQQSTHVDGFHDTVCSLVKKRARFMPALDRDGTPIRSFYRNRVIFTF